MSGGDVSDGDISDGDISGHELSGAEASGADLSADDAAWRDLIARYDIYLEDAAAVVPWPEREDLQPRLQDQALTDPGPATDTRAADTTEDHGSGAAVSPDTAATRADPDVGAGADRTRVIRHAKPARQPSAAEGDADEHFVPPEPPPLPHLDPMTKGAWTALFGGPAYLLVATSLGWTVQGWAALAAVAAFVGGFAVIVFRLSDGSSRDDGSDNGAVV